MEKLTILMTVKYTKALIGMCGWAGWSALLLFANSKNIFFAWRPD